MKYSDLNIQTQREFPNNARTPGLGWLVRAGYLNRERQALPLGVAALRQLEKMAGSPLAPQALGVKLSLPLISSKTDGFFLLQYGSQEVIYCAACHYADRAELAQGKKTAFSSEANLPVEKVLTPECETIEALAAFLNLPKEKTAKALMYTRAGDGRFIFVVVRGDMQLSESKLRRVTGEVRPATMAEIQAAGAAAGYASPLGLKDALVIVDDLIPASPNLAAGANEHGFHLLNTNCGRDYQPDIVADLTQVNAGDACHECGAALQASTSLLVMRDGKLDVDNLLLAVAECHHDEKGLSLPGSAAPFEVYLMHVVGRQLDTCRKAGEIHQTLEAEGVRVLFDDRDERAGVKFNDADLIGCPVRVTVGEKALQNGMVEFKLRKEKENRLVSPENLMEEIARVRESGRREGN